ncbi:unnamed protein product, partial [marine sediment metagenome]
MNQQDDNNISRRKFIARAAKAGVSIAAAGAAAYLVYDKKGPGPRPEDHKLVKLADFSVAPRFGQTISIVKGFDRAKSLRKAIELLGGIERFVKQGETVAIKPNVAFALPAILGATARPRLITETVRLCYKAGAKRVYVTDNPINDPASCFALSGIAKAAEEAGAKIILPRKHMFKPTTLTGGKLIRDFPIFYEPLAKVDKLIGITPVKDHQRAAASMTMKNWYGLLGEGRNVFHQD